MPLEGTNETDFVFSTISIKACRFGQNRETLVNRERAAEINLHTVARDSTASEPIHAGIVIKLRFSVTGAPAVTKLQVMPRVTQRSGVPYGLKTRSYLQSITKKMTSFHVEN